MIIKLEENISQEDIEVLVKYARMNKQIKRIITLLKSVDSTVKCTLDHSEIWVNASDIYYIESVDKRTFIYCEKTVYHTELRLYQMIEELAPLGFAQISKSCILNLNVLKSIKPMINSRLEAILTNGERLNVTRKYLTDIKTKLQER
jgi:DNA-binding LytR/AlgR family response regulator